MGDLMGHSCGFIETNRILAWLLGCLAAWLLGCLAAVAGKSYFPLRPKLMVNERPCSALLRGLFLSVSIALGSVLMEWAIGYHAWHLTSQGLLNSGLTIN